MSESALPLRSLPCSPAQMRAMRLQEGHHRCLVAAPIPTHQAPGLPVTTHAPISSTGCLASQHSSTPYAAALAISCAHRSGVILALLLPAWEKEEGVHGKRALPEGDRAPGHCPCYPTGAARRCARKQCTGIQREPTEHVLTQCTPMQGAHAAHAHTVLSHAAHMQRT